MGEMRAAVVSGERDFVVASAADPVPGISVICGAGLNSGSGDFARLFSSTSDRKMLARFNG
jgi:hypothetical protein